LLAVFADVDVCLLGRLLVLRIVVIAEVLLGLLAGRVVVEGLRGEAVLFEVGEVAGFSREI